MQLSLVFTRDYSLATNELWWHMATRGLKGTFGTGLTDQVIHYNGRASACFRLQADLDAWKNAVIPQLKKRQLFGVAMEKKFRSEIKNLRAMCASVMTVPPRSYANYYKKIISTWVRLYPFFTACTFVPLWADDVRLYWGDEGDSILKRFIMLRTFCEGAFESADNALRHIFSYYLLQSGLPKQWARLIRYREGERLVKTGRLPGQSILKQRSNGYVFIRGRLYVLNKFETLLARVGYQYIPAVVHNEKVIQGTVACLKVPVTGTVKIILNYDEVAGFPRRGGVLVTTMTTPEFVPAMKRALAVVTDEGGITSHAAIVSRELNIPCVIGTKIATKVLKDGDRVIVDATKGIIKKLTK